MDFVKVMGIAKRYGVWRSDTERNLPEWFRLAFLRTPFCVTLEDFETAQRELLSWAEQHPEKTDTKEEKTVENESNGSKRTNVHELLGVEPGEKFKCNIMYYESAEFVFEGDVLYAYQGGSKYDAGSSFLFDLINDPSLIIRHPTLTEEQREVLVAMDGLGFKVVCKDEDGQIFAYSELPEKDDRQWYYNFTRDVNPTTSYAGGPFLDCLRTLLPDWTKPLDIKATLKEAGV